MSIQHLFRDVVARRPNHHSNRARRRSSVSLAVELLEDRCVMANYPNVGCFPIAMNPIPDGFTPPANCTTAPTPAPPWAGSFYQAQGTFNADGTLMANPVVPAGPQQFTQNGSTVTYNTFALNASSSIYYGGKQYTVYSAVPREMTTDFAYKNLGTNDLYYDVNELSLGGINFPNPPPSCLLTKAGNTCQSNNTTVVSQAVQASQANPFEMAYVTQLGTNTGFFLPNLPNASNADHSGLTSNVYFNFDPYIEQPGYLPNQAGTTNGAPHLTPYGWALDPRTVNSSIIFNYLAANGTDPLTVSGNTTQTLQQSAPPFNYFTNSVTYGQANYATITGAINTQDEVSNYPFPDPTWLQHGAYLPYMPMPGFQSNLVRYYTAAGAWNLINNSSGLFVRNDGTVELPADGSNKAYPLVTQTWTGTQQFSILNLTDQVIPSAPALYPMGGEVYFAGNAFLPNSAGVWTAQNNYTVQDAPGFSYRQQDLWLGLAGDTVEQAMQWDYDLQYNPDSQMWLQIEPGGQANKPYILDADNQLATTLKSSNSMMVAQLTSQQLQGKLYSATLYMSDDNVTQPTPTWYKVGTLSTSFKNWSISNNQWQNTGWTPTTGSAVPVLEVTQADFDTLRQNIPTIGNMVLKVVNNSFANQVLSPTAVDTYYPACPSQDVQCPGGATPFPFNQPDLYTNNTNNGGSAPRWYEFDIPYNANYRFLVVLDETTHTSLVQLQQAAQRFNERVEELTTKVLENLRNRRIGGEFLSRLLLLHETHQQTILTLADAVLQDDNLSITSMQRVIQIKNATVDTVQQSLQHLRNVRFGNGPQTRSRQSLARAHRLVENHVLGIDPLLAGIFGELTQ